MDAFAKGYETSHLSETGVSLIFTIIKPIKSFTKYLLASVCLFRAIWMVNQSKYISYCEASLFVSST